MDCLWLSCTVAEWCYRLGLFKSCMEVDDAEDIRYTRYVSSGDEPNIPKNENEETSTPVNVVASETTSLLYQLSYTVNGLLKKEKYASFRELEARILELGKDERFANYCINYA